MILSTAFRSDVPGMSLRQVVQELQIGGTSAGAGKEGHAICEHRSILRPGPDLEMNFGTVLLAAPPGSRVPQFSDRRFGGHIEWKVAPGEMREEC